LIPWAWDTANIYKGLDEGYNIMVRILYGLCSVGIGHAIRAKTILKHLKKKNEIMTITSHRAYDILSKESDNVYNIEGLEVLYHNNKALTLKTILKNIGKFSVNNYQKLKGVGKKIDDFKPQVVISDWESVSSFTARARKILLISLDNQAYLKYGKYKKPFMLYLQYLKARFFLKTLVREADHSIVMLWPGMELKKKEGLYGVSPIIRDEIKEARKKKGDHILVYDSTRNHEKLMGVLREIKMKFIVYGYDRVAKEGNIQFKGFDDTKEFVKDLTSCKAVITNAGFTLISECLYLEKPLLCIPIRKHFEQILNARYVKKYGYGEMNYRLSVKNVRNFIKNLKNYNYKKPDFKEDLLETLDKILKSVN